MRAEMERKLAEIRREYEADENDPADDWKNA